MDLLSRLFFLMTHVCTIRNDDDLTTHDASLCLVCGKICIVFLLCNSTTHPLHSSNSGHVVD